MRVESRLRSAVQGHSIQADGASQDSQGRLRSLRLKFEAMRARLGGASLCCALLQSLCTAVLTISGIRVAIGLSALAAASGIYAPAKGLHQDAIRIPMLIVATLGAVVNLAVLAWIWHLRNRPSAQWRRRELSAKEKRSERLQVVLAIRDADSGGAGDLDASDGASHGAAAAVQDSQAIAPEAVHFNQPARFQFLIEARVQPLAEAGGQVRRRDRRPPE